MFNSGVFPTKFGHKLLLALSAQPDYVKLCERVGKMLYALCITVPFIPIYIFNNDFYFF